MATADKAHPAELAEYEPVEDHDFANKGSSVTCITCRLLFRLPQEQKDHFKSELHRFNLKRKVVNLPPVSQTVYEQKVKGSMQEDNKAKSIKKCEFCSKNFASDATYQTHLLSKKHIEAEKLGVKPKPEKKAFTKPATIGDSEAQESDIVIDNSDGQLTAEEVEFLQNKIKNSRKLTIEDCLFCNTHSVDLSANVDHMTSVHGLFIPDIEYLKDLEGLMKYLAEKVSIGNVCLYCNGKGRHFDSLEAVQAHMRDLSHCKLLYDNNEVEYEDFYDFSTDYQTMERESSDDPNVRLSEDGNQLIFSNGKTIGHRNLALFYKQKYKIPENRECIIVNKLMSEYRLLGWYNNTQSYLNSTNYQNERRKQVNDYRVALKNNNQKFHNSQNNIIA